MLTMNEKIKKLKELKRLKKRLYREWDTFDGGFFDELASVGMLTHEDTMTAFYALSVLSNAQALLNNTIHNMELNIERMDK